MTRLPADGAAASPLPRLPAVPPLARAGSRAGHLICAGMIDPARSLIGRRGGVEVGRGDDSRSFIREAERNPTVRTKRRRALGGAGCATSALGSGLR